MLCHAQQALQVSAPHLGPTSRASSPWWCASVWDAEYQGFRRRIPACSDNQPWGARNQPLALRSPHYGPIHHRQPSSSQSPPGQSILIKEPLPLADSGSHFRGLVRHVTASWQTSPKFLLISLTKKYQSNFLVQHHRHIRVHLCAIIFYWSFDGNGSNKTCESDDFWFWIKTYFLYKKNTIQTNKISICFK